MRRSVSLYEETRTVVGTRELDDAMQLRQRTTVAAEGGGTRLKRTTCTGLGIPFFHRKYRVYACYLKLLERAVEASSIFEFGTFNKVFHNPVV